ncbi:glycogen synthase GlgA, partial [Candidatus Sumerlaeota bacterium]|nr:glycogen synthase GlgA [Candidatus Sumerlaeota bacterium]
MKILCVASEATPYVKTGGLGDVMGALPRALSALGHDVRVVLPYYSQIDPARWGAEMILDRIEVWLPAGAKSISIWKLDDPRNPVPVYLVKNDGLFGRAALYGEGGREYADNPLRYGYFCLSAFWMLKGLQWVPDIFHCHDWQAGMIPAYLRKLEFIRNDPAFAPCKTLLTIHNLAYQGVCGPEYVDLLGLPREAFNLTEMEYFGKLNLLKGGIVYSDRLSTVSRRYAGEIQTGVYGCGLEGVLRARTAHLSGIMNGIDGEVWNPETDPALPAHYSAENLDGKWRCKAELQKRFGLPEDPSAPVASIVSRLVEQKGFDLIAEAMPAMLELGIQFILLGTGEEKYQKFFRNLAQEHPAQVGVVIGFDEALSHLVQAGSDMLFMPSRFEPCGLNQLYGMRYGTVPIARQTGGLADS